MSPDATPELPKGTILVVDDEPDVLFFISKIFQPQGYHTLTAASGLEALKYIHELAGKIHLVMLDLRMPEMGGLEVLKAIRRNFKELPVIVLTAYGEDRAEVERVGVEGFLTKPYSLEELHNLVMSVLKHQAFEQLSTDPGHGMIPAAKVLIVDDEADVCDVLLEVLTEEVKDAEFEVKIAHSGEEALKIALEFEPDIAITDVRMPHMSGDELISQFKSGKSHCPKDFIIFTAKYGHEEKAKSRETGFKYVRKGTQLEHVVDALKRSCIQHGLVKPAK
jgi:CheY-like chemotaxis protein